MGIRFAPATVILLVLSGPSFGQSKLLAEVHRMIPADASFARELALGDLDGDGDLDALLESYHLYLGKGNGVFADHSSALPPSPGVDDLALADLDADGDLDAFLARFGGVLPNPVLLNDGSAGFASSSGGLPALPDQTTCVALADVDGDSDVDVVLGRSTGKPRLCKNAGAAQFADASGGVPGSILNSNAVVLFDPDRDGDTDILIGNDFASDRLYLNGGAGVFADVSSTHLPNLGPDVREYGVADLDGDADLDVVVANGSFGGTLLYANDGSGKFQDGSDKLVEAPLWSTSVDIGDVDGDGAPDVVLGSVLENALLVNDGSGVCTLAPFQLPRTQDFTYAVALGDVDGDGDLDNWIANAHQDRLQLNDGAGFFAQDQPNLPPYDDWTRSALLVDMSGDGELDAVIGNQGPNRMYFGDGFGGFVGASDHLPAAAPDTTAALAAGDVDGDGDPDLFLGNSSGNDRLLLNDGGGAFTDATGQIPDQPFGATGDAAMSDLDGDGDLDLFVSRQGSYSFVLNSNGLYLNDGQGVFTDAPDQHPKHDDDTRAGSAADVDGDGDLDLLLGNLYGQNRLYLNDGTAVFADATAQIPQGKRNTQALGVADFDEDGDPDALLGNGFEPNELWINDGTGVFADSPGAVPSVVASTVDVSVGDLDGDGDLDALLANVAGGAESDFLYLGDGAGGFSDGSHLIPKTADGTYAFALGDVDHDGDLDALAGNSGVSEGQQNRFYTNLTRQVAWSGLPRIDQPYDIEVYGGASEPWFLAWGTGAGSFPIPHFGVLRLDPTKVLVIDDWGVLPESGMVAKTFPGPSDPAFVGVNLYWQALVGAPLRFTNLDVMTFTDL